MKLIVKVIVVILLYTPQVVSAVCVQGNCINGHGTAVLPDGSKYVGGFEDGRRNGEGEVTYKDGTRYRGQWGNDLPNGQGVKILADGTQYSGEFRNGSMYGSGMMVMPDGSTIKIKWLSNTKKVSSHDGVGLPDETSEQVSPQASVKDEVVVQEQNQTEAANQVQPEDSEEIKPEAVADAGGEDGDKPEEEFPQNSEITKAVEYASIAAGANIRSGPSLASKVLRTVPAGYPVVILSEKADWFLVEDFRGRKGWVFASLVTESGTVIIKVFKGNLRNGPSLINDIIVQLDHGTVMSVLERSGKWLKVSNSKKITGWLHRKVVWP